MGTTEEVKVQKSDFEFVQLNDQILDTKFEGEPIGFFKDAMLRFKRNKSAIIASIFITIIIFMAIFGPMINPYTYRQQNLDWDLLPPRIPVVEKIGIFDGTKVMDIRKTSLEERYKDSLVRIEEEYIFHYRGEEIPMVKARIDVYELKNAEDQYFWFGTDSLGRDQWTRLWRGSRVSLMIAFLAVIINVCIGVVYGSISGYYGGMTDMLMQRFIEIISAIPTIVLVMLLMMFLGSGIFSFVLAFVFTGWIGMSRMIRAQFYKYKGQEYVLASRTMGAKDSKLIFRHILPNAIGPLITQATLAIPSAIFLESTLSYLGLGIGAPEPSIGNLLAEGQKVLLNNPHLTIFPAIVISILMLSFNLFGNGLRDAFDPTLRGHE
ncbi:ABC transporter permease [Alkaliphilus sp. MSJ-5]|uniref:ABC transporter permease n=1 Tax=Alkaliphilus flagellatus TaxID=2841507 RepID=A0ABS6FY30_9FIRM|nr:ABC transporter permease [Alkaliphilus flagellatus]MBU5674969.1 ABC transporter permease [Alkaliphilus flagellatus]